MFEQLSSLVWLHFTGNVIVLYLFKKEVQQSYISSKMLPYQTNKVFKY